MRAPRKADPALPPRVPDARARVRGAGLAALLTILAVSPPPSSSAAAPPPDPSTVPGISRALAASRSRSIEHVRYELAFELRPGMTQVEGRVRLSFEVREHGGAAPLVLDFGGDELTFAELDGVAVDPATVRVADHLVPGRRSLAPGAHVFRARFRSPVAAAGAPLTVFRDHATGSEYLYTLLVPADAHRLFPCLDQPDLKARFVLELTAPADWKLISNQREQGEPVPLGDGRVTQRFDETPPLPTYLFAFAAGPFAVVEAPPQEGAPPTRLFVRPSKLGSLPTQRLIRMHRDATAALARYFDVPYPFAKLDAVLLPSFPYGGMEHAGAIFYREDSLVFDHRPTDLEDANRSTLVYHEVSHQWFGNLVTMEWFDDLWLKEGFANLMAFRLLDALEPGRQAWLRFHQRLKQRAYRIDVTPGTTPIWQELHDLADAKSAYGEIVYDKAPAVLRELSSRLGEDVFRAGLTRYLRAHAWGNARWKDLIAAWSGAGASGLDAWSRNWVLSAGLPTVRVAWPLDERGRIRDFHVEQRVADDRAAARTWPLDVTLLVVAGDGSRRTIPVRCDGASTPVPELRGLPAPAWVLPNPGDTAYARFVLDERSAAALLESLPRLDEPLERAVASSALWETVRDAELDPRRFGEAALAALATERFPGSRAQLVAALTTTIERYLEPAPADALRRALIAQLGGALDRGELAGLELDSFRAIVRLARDPADLAWLTGVLDGTHPIPGLELGTRDHFEALAPLIAASEPSAATRLETLRRERAAEDGGWYAYAVGAATSAAETKERYFAGYLNASEPPEAWAEDSLEYFHWPDQDALTAPYLPRALDALGWVKEHRKIFFLPAWIDAFVNGQSSPEALAAVDRFLGGHGELGDDVRRKVLQSRDSLARAVKIRAKSWPL